MTTQLRVVFAGTPTFAAAHLKQLIASRHEVVAVYTQPDRPSGRGKRLSASPVKQIALEHGLPFFNPSHCETKIQRSNWQPLMRMSWLSLPMDCYCHTLFCAHPGLAA